MVLSMTGYGRAQQVLNGRDITVELRSVNSRYFEYSSRMPRACLCFDDAIKKAVNSRVFRGKVELGLQLKDTAGQDQQVTADVQLAGGYLAAIRQVAAELQLKDDVSVNSLLRFSDIFTTTAAPQDEEQMLSDILSVVSQAVDRFVDMRQVEGEKMKADILGRLDFLEQAVGQVEQDSAQRLEKYTEKMYAKLKTLLDDRSVDEGRILTEAAIFADKTAVDEETVRLRSHIQQYRDILAAGGAVGRKLDFLTQELNRETNTIGSKCQEIAITRLVVDMKAEIEKIREQIQNLE